MLKRKVWVTRQPWNKSSYFASTLFSDDLPVPLELEGFVSPNSDKFMYFSEVWMQSELDRERGRKWHPWLKKDGDWHETEEQAKSRLPLHLVT
jgi:hypothetical protein